MKSLRDYITESEAWVSAPSVGDEIDFEVAPDELVSTYVIESTEDTLVLACDHVLLEKIGRYGAVGNGPGIGHNVSMVEQEEELEEGKVKELAIEIEDYKRMTPQQFLAAYGMKKADWAMKNHDLLQQQHLQTDWSGTTGWDFVKEASRMMELAGVADHRFNKQDDVYSEDQSAGVVAQKELADRIDAPMPGMLEDTQGPDTVEFDIPTFIRMMEYAREDAKDDMDLHDVAEKAIELSQDGHALTMDDYDVIVGSDIDGEEEMMDEAEYQGRKVSLNKPFLTPGGPKKRSVYVKKPDGNIVKVNFGDKTMRIKKSNPERRKSFRARHHCENPGPKHKARYWSCKAW